MVKISKRKIFRSAPKTKDAPTQESVGGESPQVLEKADVSLEDSRFDFGGYEDPYQYLKQYLRTTQTNDAYKLSNDLLEQLTQEGKERLLTALIQHEAKRFDKKISSVKEMDALKPDLKPGEYPYLNGYNRDLYNKQIRQLQIELIKLQNWVQKKGKKIVLIFEGRDAAGKGGTIQRFIEHLNPRFARVAALPKPTETESGQWYFQRYVAHLPTNGEMVFFDRSWYNRAVVEPVMGFCTQDQYETFIKEVPSFEKNILSSGIILFKFWLDVSRKEQNAASNSAEKTRSNSGSFLRSILLLFPNGMTTPKPFIRCSSRPTLRTLPGPLLKVTTKCARVSMPSD